MGDLGRVKIFFVFFCFSPAVWQLCCSFWNNLEYTSAGLSSLRTYPTLSSFSCARPHLLCQRIIAMLLKNAPSISEREKGTDCSPKWSVFMTRFLTSFPLIDGFFPRASSITALKSNPSSKAVHLLNLLLRRLGNILWNSVALKLVEQEKY